ncbi:hypothetical protein ACJX0J_031600, partial [Zea mays]
MNNFIRKKGKRKFALHVHDALCHLQSQVKTKKLNMHVHQANKGFLEMNEKKKQRNENAMQLHDTPTSPFLQAAALHHIQVKELTFSFYIFSFSKYGGMKKII